MNADPHEINNLAGGSQHGTVLKEMRAELERWMIETKDLGAMPESEMIRQGIIADQREEYARRVRPLEIPLIPRSQ